MHNNVDFSSYCYTESRFYLVFLRVLPALIQYVEMKQCSSNQTVSGCQEVLIEVLPIYHSVPINRVLLFSWYFVGTCTIMAFVVYHFRILNPKTLHKN